MKLRRLLALVLAAIMVMGLAACGGGKADEPGALNIFMWSEYLSPDVVKDFEEQYNIKVTISYMNTSEEAAAKITSGGGSEYDLVMPCDIDMTALIEGGHLEEINLDNLPNLHNLNDAFIGRSFDPENKYAIPYLMNYIYIVYNKETCPIEITCYEDLKDPALEGKLTSVTGISNLFPMALAACGLDPNSQNEDEIAQAYEWLRGYMKNVRSLTSDSTEQDLLNGTCCAAYLFDGQASRAFKQVDNLVVADIPDPLQLGFDNFVIPKGAKNKENAERFLNYILDADVMAKNLEYVPFSCPNEAAVAKASEEYRNNPAINIPAHMKSNYFGLKDLGDAAIIYDKYWTQLLAE